MIISTKTYHLIAVKYFENKSRKTDENITITQHSSLKTAKNIVTEQMFVMIKFYEYSLGHIL